jgi:hypothetical protein
MQQLSDSYVGPTRRFLPVPDGWKTEHWGLSTGQTERRLYAEGTDVPAVRRAIFADHFQGPLAPPLPSPSPMPSPPFLPPVEVPEPAYSAPHDFASDLLPERNVVTGTPDVPVTTPEFRLEFHRRKWRRVRRINHVRN